MTRHPFLVVNLFNFMFGACVFGCFTFVPYYASVQYGMGPFESGAVLTPRSVTMIVVSACTSLFIMRLGYRLPIVLGHGRHDRLDADRSARAGTASRSGC